MKKFFLLIFSLFMFLDSLLAQCSICTKTAEQLGEGPAKALNGAIVYLMVMPFLIVAVIAYRWWKGEKQSLTEQDNSSF